jgi:hypothetical protein
VAAIVGHSLLAVLSLVACVVMRRREREAVELAAHHRESAVLAVDEVRRLRGELASLSGRALAIERGVGRLNQRIEQREGRVSEAGAVLACAVLQLRQDIDEVQHGSVRE